MRVELTVKDRVVAYKNSNKAGWKLVDADYLFKCLEECGGKISKLIDLCNLNSRSAVTKIIDLCPKCKSYRKTAKRQVKTSRGTIFYENYEVIRINGKAKKYHRYLMEKKIGRKLEKKEIVHHIDCNKLNNNIANLFLCSSISEHNLIHDNLEKIAGRLVEAGIIVFCPDIKKYIYIHDYPQKKEVEI